MTEFQEKLHKSLIDRLESSVEFTVATFLNDKCGKVAEKVIETPLDKLPLLINEYDEGSLPAQLIANRLEGKEVAVSDLIPLLYDENFDAEDYRNLGYNDGQASILSDLLTLLGDHENANKAAGLIYG